MTQVRRLGYVDAVMPRLRLILSVAALAAVLVAPSPAAALSLPGVTPPVLRNEVAAGTGTLVERQPRRDGVRRIDGRATDWGGRAPGFGGALAYSHGELVYRDHIFDAYGADDGQDAQRLAAQGPLNTALPELYRIEPALQYVPQEFGVPTGPLKLAVHYGDLEHVDQADLSELRLGAARGGALDVLARTTTMSDDAPATALLLLLDTAPGAAERTVPFASGLKTRRGDVAVLLTARGGRWVDLASGVEHRLPGGAVATGARGYANTIEARLPAAALRGAGETVGVAAAAGLAAAEGTALKPLGLGPNVANVAFRTREPARDWWERDQALALHGGSIDAFFADADRARMAAGANERYVPGSGYHDRIFSSTPRISREKGQEGVLQHYGVYLPTAYRAGRRSPAQYWFHFRGGNAHIAAAVSPGIFQDMGEDQDSIVITPDGRGTSGWYVGRSQVDVEEVWADSHRLFDIDRDRTYIAGHSMGGWASYLLPIVHPDRFAASFPASGPPTQGQWLGCEQDACYEGANGGDPRAELTQPLLDNLREVPVAIYQGAADELVPVTGPVRQAQRLRELGYRYRFYAFAGQEHYGPPIVDQWADGAAYEHRFTRDRNPPEVTYIRSMRFERAVERVNSGGVDLSFDFDRAYWMSGLEPVDAINGVARFDGRSLALARRRHALAPEVGGPATTQQSGPYTMAGQAWRATPDPAPSRANGFAATLTGARAVTLRLSRMGLDARRELTGAISTQAPLALTLRGRVPAGAGATIDGKRATVRRIGGRGAVVMVPSGAHRLVLAP